MIGTSELILILIAALFLFGPNKLPELARSLGKAAGEFKRAQAEAEFEIKKLDRTMNDKDHKIQKLAKEMGLDPINKTTEQLIEEIRNVIKTQDATLKKAGI